MLGGIAFDFVEEFGDVRAGGGQVVVVELEVAVGPVQRPLAALAGMAQPRDGMPCPFGAELVAPRGAAFDDGDRLVGGLDLNTDLVAGTFGDTLFGPPPRALRRVTVTCSRRATSSSSSARWCGSPGRVRVLVITDAWPPAAVLVPVDEYEALGDTMLPGLLAGVSNPP